MTRLSLAVIALAGLHSVAAITTSNAEASFNTLLQWYNHTNGLFVPSTGWWNSANCITAIADLAKIDAQVNIRAQTIFPETWVLAQLYNLQMQKVFGPGYLVTTFYSDIFPEFPPGWNRPPPLQMTGFLNDYYDDEGWWALAWIAAYDVTNNPQYLATAQSIFEDMKKVYGTTGCGGGIWWNRAQTYVNAIANELFLDVAAHLANRSGRSSAYYLSWAQKEWTWFKNSGMINSEYTINDGLDNSCKNNGGTVWSYNQGVILGGLTELSRATNDAQYIDEAKKIADAAIAALTTNGILHDPCEPNCGADGSQFKGVFARNLQLLQQASPEARYKQFLQDNADSIWAHDRNANNELSLIWSGPFVQTANASTQSSALDAITGALAVAQT
ncbi:Hypothetical protein R9X50_00657100 [Acrodontium crateriforme]|uniref:Glycoside hydrolase family 76 protein n=1 Tax=Acrodontium crateriforme TaxID=150365 RepID=A0AAQ3RDP0_9PEZI|nr:Hypothetical protein R9X50_00657100 [Acrodontium crateriforme]